MGTSSTLAKGKEKKLDHDLTRDIPREEIKLGQ